MKYVKFGFILIVSCSVFMSHVQSMALSTNQHDAQEVLAAVNAYRKQHGLHALKNSAIISHEARQHSLDMAKKTVSFGHAGFNTRIKHIYAHFTQAKSGAENVAYFPPSKSATEVVRLWTTSPGHRRNIVGHYNYTGIGVVHDKRGWVYYTQTFVLANS